MTDGQGREAGDQHNHGSGTFIGRVVGDVTINHGASASRSARRDASALRSSTENQQLEEAAHQLAQAVGAQWRREEERRRVHDPFPLPVRWHLAPEALTDHWANIHSGSAGVTFGPLALAGELDRVVDVYQRIPSGRLVVLGRVGSGKTVLTLRFVLDLLDARAGADLVPVIFGLGSWNPTTTSLRDWLTDQLLRDHPGLAAPGPTGSSLAAALVEVGRILPVLDGFDEIADGLHRAALEALNATRMPLLLTSRPDEYATAVEAADVLTAAAGIELDDLTLTDLADYLPRTTRKTAAGNGITTAWDPVLARLPAYPSSPAEANLTAVLSTPLMVVLARTIYSDTPDRDPAELLDTHQFGTAQALEDHLLSAFLPAVYQHPPPDRRFGHPRYRSWDPDRVQYWLGYLAWHLNRLGTTDLAWWHLGNTITRPTRMLVGGLTIGLAAALANGLANGLLIGFVVVRTYMGWDGAIGLAFPFTGGLRTWLMYGLVSGLAAGLVAGIAFGLRFGIRSEGREPSRIQLQIRGRARQLLGQIADGLVFGFAAWLVIGLASGLAAVLASQVIGWRRTFGLLDVLQSLLWIGPRFGLVVGVVFGLAFGLQIPTDIRTAPSPSELLTANRKNAVFQSCVGWLAFGLALGLVGGLANALVGGFVWGFVVRLSTDAWGRWLILSRIWLPMTGRLPWALIAFLKDAHQRGMLRQVGAAYQFRHARLQNHLAHLYQTRGDKQPATSP